jgi:hypothetical protein
MSTPDKIADNVEFAAQEAARGALPLPPGAARLNKE